MCVLLGLYIVYVGVVFTTGVSTTGDIYESHLRHRAISLAKSEEKSLRASRNSFASEKSAAKEKRLNCTKSYSPTLAISRPILCPLPPSPYNLGFTVNSPTHKWQKVQKKLANWKEISRLSSMILQVLSAVVSPVGLVGRK